MFNFSIKIKDERGNPGPSGIPRPDRATPTRLGSRGHILLKPGIGPVRDQENGSGRERGSFLSVRLFLFFGQGLNFDCSEIIYTGVIHEKIQF